MKLKRILAGAVAGCLLVGTVIGSSIVSSAETVEDLGTVTIGNDFSYGYTLDISDYPKEADNTATFEITYTANSPTQGIQPLAYQIAAEGADGSAIEIAEKFGGQSKARFSQNGQEVVNTVSLYDLMTGAETKGGDNFDASTCTELKIYSDETGALNNELKIKVTLPEGTVDSS